MELDPVPDSRRLAGIVTTAELAAVGISDARIRTLVRQGVLMRVHQGVYAPSVRAARLINEGERGERALRLAAAIAIVGPRAVGSHHDAAIIHGLALLDRPPAELVVVTRPPGTTASRTGRPGIRIHTATMPSRQVIIGLGLPVTSVARTVIDLARTTRFAAGVVVADSALHDQKTSKAELDAVIATCARWPGIERARQVIAFSDARSESPFESISRVAFRDGGLPAPELQVWVGGESRAIGRADFLWRSYRTVAEADGAIKYADPGRARTQLRRDAELRKAGFEVVHFSWRELTLTPEQVLQSIRAAFRRSGALRASGAC